MFNFKIPSEEKKIFTISNFFTISRLFILPFVLSFIKEPPNTRNNMIILILGLIAVITDLLDGLIARKFNQISIIGKILDPLVDKFFFATVVIFAIIYRDFPLWIGILIIARDFVILLAGFYVIYKKHIVSVSNTYGKFTVFLLAMLLGSYLFDFKILQVPLTACVIFGIFVSSVTYVKGLYWTFRS